MVSNSKSAAILSAILCLPIAFVLSLVLLDIEPNAGPLARLYAADSHADSLLSLGALGLLPAALILNLIPIVRSLRAGKSIIAHPANFLLAVILLAVITIIVGAIIVDQYPCWIGVPNCD